MNWDNATVLRFLKLYQMNSCIWDPQNSYHKNRRCVDDAWNSIKKKLGSPCTVKDLKKKKESLMSAYRGYKGKIKKSEKSGAVSGDVYQPSWFAFALMDRFLGSVYKCNSTINTENQESEDKDILDTNATAESDVLQPEQENSTQSSKSSPHQHHPSSAEHITTPVASVASKRRQHNPPELMMEQAFNFMKNVYQYQRSKDDDDECSVFGVLIAKKIRRLTEERRDIMMVKINLLFLDERRDTSRQNSASTVFSYSPSPPQFYEVKCDPTGPLSENSSQYIVQNTEVKSSIPSSRHN